MKSEIVLFGSESCIFCKKTKDWLLREKIEYSYKDVSILSNYEEFKNYKVSGIPLVVVATDDEEKVISGYSIDEFKKELLK